MEYDRDNVDEVLLALIYLTLHGDGRAWKGFDWEVLNRLHEKGMISSPVSMAKSVVLTEEGEQECERPFRKRFGMDR